MSDAEKRFDRAMKESVDISKRQYYYYPAYFVGMMTDYGSVGAAKRLLATETASDGFGTLFMHGRLDLTVEAYVVKPEFAELFSPDEIAIARKRLQDNGYKFE